MRVVGGTLKGRPLNTPRSGAIRPTTDRVRESIFNILVHGVPDFTIENALVLDLFAGSGALGLEALSRGAKFALFVEQSAEARGLIRRNIEDMGLTGVTKIYRRDATNLGDMQRFDPFNLIFLDPPYGRAVGEKALIAARDGGWMTDDAICVFEEEKLSEIDLPDGFEFIDDRTYGNTRIMILRLSV